MTLTLTVTTVAKDAIKKYAQCFKIIFLTAPSLDEILINCRAVGRTIVHVVAEFKAVPMCFVHSHQVIATSQYP